MTYTEIFGGAVLYPSNQTYLALTFSVDQTLAWPIEQQVGGNVVADLIDLTASSGGLTVNLPDARQVSNGFTTVFNNVGSNTCTIKDAGGGTIIAPASGEAWIAYLSDNSTSSGVWRTFEMGVGTSTASAASLVGAGIKAIGSSLNQKVAISTQGATPFTLTDADRAKGIIYTAGIGVANLPTPGTVGSDWFVLIRNSGTGNLVVTPAAGTVDGGATLTLATGESAIFMTDGSNFFTVGLGRELNSSFDFLSIAVGGTGTYTLSGVELNRVSYRFTGILTGTRNIVVPNSIQEYWVDNQTTGAFSLFVKTAAQTPGIEIQQGDRNILYCDGTEVVHAESLSLSLPVSIAQGGTGGISAGAARTNLAVPPETRLISSGTGITGGGDLTGDRTLNLDFGALAAVTVVDQGLDQIMINDLALGPKKTSVSLLLNPEQGLFSANSFTGFSANPSINFSYIVIGSVVFLYVRSASVTGTSNDGFFTFAGIPSAIRPLNITTTTTAGLGINQSGPYGCMLQITTVGTAVVVLTLGGTWGTAGNKGLADGACFMYNRNLD